MAPLYVQLAFIIKFSSLSVASDLSDGGATRAEATQDDSDATELASRLSNSEPAGGSSGGSGWWSNRRVYKNS